jgi:hypothetical protein
MSDLKLYDATIFHSIILNMKLFLKIITILVILYLLAGIIFAFVVPGATPYRYDHSDNDKKYISVSDLIETSVIWPLYFLIQIH